MNDAIKQPKKPRKLTRKQEAFVHHIVDNPKDGATQAALAAYDTTDYQTAATIGSELLKKPEIITELSKYNNMVENSIITTINRYKDSEALEEVKEAMQNARWVHDKIHGKATQQIETRATSITLNIDLTSPGDAS